MLLGKIQGSALGSAYWPINSCVIMRRASRFNLMVPSSDVRPQLVELEPCLPDTTSSNHLTPTEREPAETSCSTKLLPHSDGAYYTPHKRPKVHGHALKVLSVINDMTKWVVSAVVFATLLWHHNEHAAWCVVGAILSSFICKVLKHILNHERPATATKADPGMPSSHANSKSQLPVYHCCFGAELPCAANQPFIYSCGPVSAGSAGWSLPDVAQSGSWVSHLATSPCRGCIGGCYSHDLVCVGCDMGCSSTAVITMGHTCPICCHSSSHGSLCC
eukprot:jgi/Chrzof1/13734/Cz08g10040.t1_PAP[v5.2]